MRRTLGKIVASLPYLAAAVALACGIMSYVGIRYARQDAGTTRPLMIASMEWPRVQGRIVGNDIREDVAGRFSHSPSTHYLAEPEYAYTLAGEDYRYALVCPSRANCGIGTDQEDARALLGRFPVGSVVDVYYDPGAPGTSVLRPATSASVRGLDREIAGHWRLGVISGLLALALAVHAVRTAPEFKA